MHKVAPEWIRWGAGMILTVIGSGLAGVIWMYENFETKAHALEARDAVIQRLDRIESKVDRLIERKR
jgi:hypothetical protein